MQGLYWGIVAGGCDSMDRASILTQFKLSKLISTIDYYMALVPFLLTFENKNYTAYDQSKCLVLPQDYHAIL